MGAKLHGFWYPFGEYDAYSLWEAPGNVSLTIVTMALSGWRRASKFEATVWLTVEETMDAMQRARFPVPHAGDVTAVGRDPQKGMFVVPELQACARLTVVGACAL